MNKSVEHLLTALPLAIGLAFVGYRYLDSGSVAAEKPPILLSEGDVFPTMQVKHPSGFLRPLQTIIGAKSGIIAVVHPGCGHCHDEVAAMQALQPHLHDGVFAVVISVGDSAATAAFRSSFTDVTIVEDVAHRLQNEYGLSLVPIVFRIDVTGEIRDVHVGAGGVASLRNDLPIGSDGALRPTG